MRYLVNLELGKENCFSELYWTEGNNDTVLTQEPFNNQLLECEYTDLTVEDLMIINGVIVVDNIRYLSNRHDSNLEQLRMKREPLLVAYDKYKSSAIYNEKMLGLGIEIPVTYTTGDYQEITDWYIAILDLDGVAIDNPPTQITYFMS